MKKLTLALLILALLLCGIWTVAAAETENTGGDELHAALQHVTDSPVWVTNLPAAQDENTRQLFIVAGMGMDKTTASVSMHQRGEDGSWQQILSTPAYVGRNGLCLDADHAEGCGQTPIGVYRFNRAFGIAAINTIKSIIGVNPHTYVSAPAVHGMSAVGGYSGNAVKPIALRFIAELGQNPALKGMHLSAMGGVETWLDALEFILLGGGSIQVTTAVMQYG